MLLDPGVQGPEPGLAPETKQNNTAAANPRRMKWVQGQTVANEKERMYSTLEFDYLVPRHEL